MINFEKIFPTMSLKFHTLTVAKIIHETEDCVSIEFKIPAHEKELFQYKSGQYLTFKKAINGEEIRRSYSLSSAPFEGIWRVAIKKIPNGLFSTFANEDLKVGETLEVMPPMGNFVLHSTNENSKNYALFAAGSGITPILSIAKSILKEDNTSTVHLFYGNKGFGSIVYREELEGLKNSYLDRFSLVHILSRESLGNPLQKGRIDKEKTLALKERYFKDQQIDDVFICGPEDMIMGVKEALIEKGMDAKHIHFELFNTSSVKKEVKVEDNSTEIAANVTIILDGDELEIALSSKGENILDAAQKAGADLPFACKGGVCCTCKAKILEGSAVMDVNYALEPDEVEAGYILTCQAHPTSEKLVVSFDE
jgi:ring-1,2-phenylacetyl-CoA epoxidase subunit PaaE